MFKKLNAYGEKINSYDLLKLAGLFTMVVDHLGAYFWQDEQWLRAIGRMAFPLFLFLVGYSGRWKVKPNLLIQAGGIILCAALTNQRIIPLNILVTIAITRYVMPWFTRTEPMPRHLCVIFIICIVWFLPFFWFDYSTLAFLFAMCGYLVRQKPEATKTRIFLYATLILHFLIQYYSFPFHAGSAILMLLIATLTALLMRNFPYSRIPDFPPSPLLNFLKWTARNTLPLYTLHVALFMILERILFPERLLHFHWF